MPELTEKKRKQNLLNATWETAKQMTHKSVRTDSEAMEKLVGVCLYQAPDGNRCFIGARIRPGSYKSEMDTIDGDTSVGNLFENFPTIRDEFEEDGFSSDIYFLKHLQEIHDEFFEDRFFYLRQLASCEQLTTPEDNATEIS